MIEDIREEMAAALNSIDGLRSVPYITEEIAPPMALFDYEIEPDLVFANGAHVYTFTITVFAQRTDVVASQKLLDRLRDPSASTGVKQTLQEWSWTSIDDLRVTAIGRVDPKTVGQSDYLIVDIEVEVTA